MQTVEELRSELIELGLTEAEAEEIKGKQNLVSKKEELEADKESKEMLDGAEIEDESYFIETETVKVEPESKDDDVPNPSQPAWTDYVLSHLQEDEKFKDRPTADGLRRLTEVFVGEVIDIDTNVVQCPSLENGRNATVVVKILVDNGNSVYTSSGAADVNHDYVPSPFNRHLVATAETKAEGRAFKRILKLRNVVSAEEMQEQDNEESNTEKITAIQIASMDSKASKLDIDVKKFLGSYDVESADLMSMSKVQATRMCQELNRYGNIGVPEKITGYKSNWQPSL